MLPRELHGVVEKPALFARPRQHLGRGCAVGLVNTLAQRVHGAGVARATVGGVQHLGKRLHVVKQLVRQGTERLLAVVRQQLQLGLATGVDDAAFVFVVFALLAAGDGRTFTEQTHQQQHIGKRTLFGGNANVDKRVQVEQAHLDVFNAVFLQRLGRALAQFANALGANAGIKLVLYLQQVGVELLPVCALAHADFFVKRVGRADRGFQCLGVFGQ